MVKKAIAVFLLLCLMLLSSCSGAPSDYSEDTARNAVIEYYKDSRAIELTPGEVTYEGWDSKVKKGIFTVRVDSTSDGGDYSHAVEGRYYVEKIDSQYLVYSGGSPVFGYFQQGAEG